MGNKGYGTENLDRILAVQISIAWAGEGGEEPRLNWWDTEVMSEFGGYDNLKELVPGSAEWLGLKTIREAAKRTDEEYRNRASNPDELSTLYHLGYELDEQLEQRLSDLIHRQTPLSELLKHMKWITDPVEQEWEPKAFETWLTSLVNSQKIKTNKESVGCRLTGTPPDDIFMRICRLAGADLELGPQVGRETILRTKLNDVLDKYDWILIDCPPSLGVLSMNAVVAAKEILIPLQTEYFALQGMDYLFQFIKVVKERINPDVQVSWIVPCQVDIRRTIDREILAHVEQHFSNKITKSRIRKNVALVEAGVRGLDILTYNNKSHGALDYMSLAKEVSL